jgi:5'-3' exonuclease
MNNNLNIDLIIDGNYILSKLVFTLHKNNLLYGALHKALENSISNYRNWFPFSNVYLVSDSKEKSWRKKFISSYKKNRKRDSEIDWEFVYNSYNEVKENLTGIKVLEAPHVEGDDWISFLTEKSNSIGNSVIIISNDYDIKQLINFNLDKLYINVMSNEMYNSEKIFLPKNYSIFINKISHLPNDDIFQLNSNSEFIKLFKKFIKKYEIKEIDSKESLFIKLVSGDKSDNIESAWTQVKNGKKRGIGEKGAKTIYDMYISEFGEVDLQDSDFYENIADLICEKKKLNKSNIEDIILNIKQNSKLIDLRILNLPNGIVNSMREKYENI